MAATTATTATTSLPLLRIGMFGAGTVGGGVYDILMGRLGGSSSAASSASAASSTPPTPPLLHRRPCVITKICVRTLSKPRDFHLDTNATTLVTDVNSILNDDSIELIVEVMGGTGLAKDVVLKALAKGKSVVTANKALIAECLEEIDDAVRKSSGSDGGGGGGGGQLLYEAAVCGGIPIIETLKSCYGGDIVHGIMGICNGTTNYMLGKMETGVANYDEVLKEAQDLGYAEADPTADVEGYDVRAKIAILAKLAFGTTVPVDSIPCNGITQITSVDFEYAKKLGCTIKLVGTAERLSEYGEHDGPLSVYVAPKIVPNSHLLASARGAGNAIAIHSANLGISSYTGPGAGRFPTANSVVADILRVAASSSSSSAGGGPFPLKSNINLNNNYTSAFYIRIPFQDRLGIIRIVGEIAERNGVSIHSVLQNPIENRMAADFVVTTEECKLSQVQGFCADLVKEEFALREPLCMPMLLL